MAFIKATGHCFTLDDVIYNFDYKKRLNITCKDSEELIGDRHISRLIKAIFRTCLELVLKDIVENNTVFWLPTNKIKSCIKMQAITGDDFKKLDRNINGLMQILLLLTLQVISQDFLCMEIELREKRIFM